MIQIRVRSVILRSTDTFEINRERAIDYLNTRENVYVFDGYAGVRICFHLCYKFTADFLRSGIPDTASKSELSVLEHTMRFSWSVICRLAHPYPESSAAQHAHPPYA